MFLRLMWQYTNTNLWDKAAKQAHGWRKQEQLRKMSTVNIWTPHVLNTVEIKHHPGAFYCPSVLIIQHHE